MPIGHLTRKGDQIIDALQDELIKTGLNCNTYVWCQDLKTNCCFLLSTWAHVWMHVSCYSPGPMCGCMYLVIHPGPCVDACILLSTRAHVWMHVSCYSPGPMCGCMYLVIHPGPCVDACILLSTRAHVWMYVLTVPWQRQCRRERCRS